MNSLNLRSSTLSVIVKRLQSLRENHQTAIIQSLDKESDVLGQVRLVKTSVESLIQEISAIGVLISELNAKTCEIREALKNTKSSIENVQFEMERIARVYGQRLIDMKKGIEGIQKNYWGLNGQCLNDLLGVEFINQGDLLLVKFHQLGSTNANEHAFVKLRAMGDRIEGISCVPMIEHFGALVNQVNDSLEFGLFICHLRNGFKDLL